MDIIKNMDFMFYSVWPETSNGAMEPRVTFS